MVVWETYAHIGGDNKVKNVAAYHRGDGGYTLANIHAIEAYGADAFAVEATQYPVQIGDDYDNGLFKRNGVIIERIPTDEEEIAALNSAVDDLAVAILEG